jgi:tRNA (guanine-N7-)-methyltransferase
MTLDRVEHAVVKPSVLYPLKTVVEALDLKELFPKLQPLEVELCAGDGTFILAMAKLHPERNFLAVDRLLGRARKIGRKGGRAGFANLRAVRLEGSYFLKYLLPPRSAEVLHIYFPDPWPKRRHWERRLINAEFTDIAAQALAPGGTVLIRTDDASYYAQIQTVFGANPKFQPTSMPEDLSGLLTDFEQVFRAKGVETLRASYRLAVT